MRIQKGRDKWQLPWYKEKISFKRLKKIKGQDILEEKIVQMRFFSRIRTPDLKEIRFKTRTFQ